MTEFVLNKHHFREVLIFCFYCNKTAAEAHRLLVEVYKDSAPTDKSCRDWYRRFKRGDFSVKDKPRNGAPKKFQDEDLEALLNADPCQTKEKLAISLGVTTNAVSVRLKAIQKQGIWMPYEMKPEESESKRKKPKI